MRPPVVGLTRRPRVAAAWLGALVVCAALGFGTLGARRALDIPPATLTVDAAEQTITQKELRSALGYLAADARAGRGVSHEGNEAAVRYLVKKMTDAGVTPAADGFLQPVPLVTARLGSRTRLSFRDTGHANRERFWTPGEEFFPVLASAVATVEAPLIYAGAGIVDAEQGIDDFSSLDVRNHIVVVLDQSGPRPPRSSQPRPEGGSPRMPPDPSKVEFKAREAAVRGASGVIVVSRERRLRAFSATWPTSPSVRETTYHLDADALTIPVARVSASVASDILGLGKPDSPARDVNGLFNNPSFRFASTTRLRLTVDLRTKSVNAPNVLGFVEGRDPVLKSELVVVSAHLDHDGIDDQGRIYNGADDDGSGTVAVVEIAGAFAAAARQGGLTRRSVLLALFNAEERGLLGSRHFAANPLPLLHRPVANLNLDMVGRHEEIPRTNDPRFRGLQPRPEHEARTLFHILGYSLSPDLAAVVKEEAERVGLSAREEYDENPSNLLRRSDHWSFLAAGVPALFLTTGLHPTYHTPRDDVADIDFENLERMARLTFRAAWRIAEAGGEARLTATPTSEP